MPDNGEQVPVLGYEPKPVRRRGGDQPSVSFAPMRKFRMLTGYAAVLTILVAAMLPPVFLLLPLLAAIVFSCISLYYMTRGAIDEVGIGYAIRHLLLALVLLPFCFVGLFLVSGLIESDLLNWRLSKHPQAREAQVLDNNPPPLP